MICESLQRSAWSKVNCNGKINYGAAHEIFMVKKSLYLNIHQKPLTLDHQSSSILHRKPIITESDEKRQVISGSRKGWGTGYESYFSLQRYLSFIGAWGGGGGGEKQLDFLFQCHLSVAQCAKFSMGSRFTDVRRHSLWTQYDRV